MSPRASAACAARMGVCQRKFSCTISGTPAVSQACTIDSASARVGAKGFWQMQASPACAAIVTSAAWLFTVVAMSTKSSDSCASISSAFAKVRGMPKRCEVCCRRCGSASHTATMSTPSSCCQACR